MRRILSYIYSSLIYCGISIIMLKLIPFRGYVNTWQDIAEILPVIFPLYILFSIIYPIIKVKNKSKNGNLSN